MNVNSKPKNSLGRTLFCAALIAAAVLTVLCSDASASAALSAILLCGRVLIPTVFPFLVISGVLIRCGFASFVGRFLGRPIRKLFGISYSCSAAVVTGLLCGFPAGAAAAYLIRQRGECDRASFDTAVLVSSIASPSFVIMGIGKGMAGSVRYGVMLWIIQLIAVTLTGIIFSRFFRSEAQIRPARTVYSPISKSMNPVPALAEAVREASLSMISVCGAVIFFSVPVGLAVSSELMPGMLKCAAASVFELTSGASVICSSLGGCPAAVLLSAAAGWSGLSVQAQTASVCGGELNMLYFTAGKAVTALLAAVLAFAFFSLGIM